MGCSSQVLSTTVTEPDGMVLTGSVLSESPDHDYNISCNGGNDGSIGITVSGGSGNYIYTWSGPDGFTSGAKEYFRVKSRSI